MTSPNTETITSQTPQQADKTTITLTDSAVAKVKDFYSKMPDANGKVFRVYVEGGGCSGMQYGFQFDDKHDDDTVLQYGDITVVVDPNSLIHIGGSTVDFVENFMSSGFTVQNPKAKASCGCGTSFSV